MRIIGSDIKPSVPLLNILEAELNALSPVDTSVLAALDDAILLAAPPVQFAALDKPDPVAFAALDSPFPILSNQPIVLMGKSVLAGREIRYKEYA